MKMEINKILPNDEGLEAVVLGTLLQSEGLNEAREIITPDVFYNAFHRDVYRAIISLDEKGIRADIVVVSDEMKRMGFVFDLMKLLSLTESIVPDIHRHAMILLELKKRRDLILLSQKMFNSSFELSEEFGDILSLSENGLKEIASDSRAEFSSIGEAVWNVQKQIEINNSESDAGLTGTPTGFGIFDARSGGIQKSDLIVIGGSTSSGKTSLATSIALNAASTGGSIAMYSMEMKKEQIAARMMSIKSGVPANQILYSRLVREQFEAIGRGVASLYDRKIYFDDRSTSSIDTIISSIRTLRKKHGIDGAIVDYLQILNVNMKGASPEQQMGTAARRLKNLAKELDIWIIAISQLSRDNANPVPSLSRLRDSGQIEEAADVVILIYRPESVKRDSYPEPFRHVSVSGTAMIDVAKGRNIGLLKFIVGFESHTTRFYDINESDYISSNRNSDDDPF